MYNVRAAKRRTRVTLRTSHQLQLHVTTTLKISSDPNWEFVHRPMSHLTMRQLEGAVGTLRGQGGGEGGGVGHPI